MARRSSDLDTLGLWISPDGRLVHPDAPAGAGGQAFFRSPRPIGSEYNADLRIAHPHSPIGRRLISGQLQNQLQAQNAAASPISKPPKAEEVRAAIVRIAKGYVDSLKWQEYPGGPAKCSAFVNDVLTEAGCAPGLLHKTSGYYLDQLTDSISHLFHRDNPHSISKHQYPPLAGDWANPDFSVPHWIVVPAGPSTAQFGDIIAESINYSDASGHVGIVVGMEQTASADSTVVPPGRITLTNYGFRGDDDSKKHGHASKCVLRRYTD